jgi:hypothetical protein
MRATEPRTIVGAAMRPEYQLAVMWNKLFCDP